MSSWSQSGAHFNQLRRAAFLKTALLVVSFLTTTLCNSHICQSPYKQPPRGSRCYKVIIQMFVLTFRQNLDSKHPALLSSTIKCKWWMNFFYQFVTAFEMLTSIISTRENIIFLECLAFKQIGKERGIEGRKQWVREGWRDVIDS